MGVKHFKTLFKEPEKLKMGEILKLISYLRRLVEDVGPFV
jgi:hypothetical protein